MLKGCYYRCPIPIEEGDTEHPHFFVLGQLLEYNELANSVKVKIHDLLGSECYYSSLFKYNVFFASSVTHCQAPVGGVIEGKWGLGEIASIIEPADNNKPYWYYIKLPNGQYIKTCETDLKIEYSQMNYSPAKQLRNYEFQNPSWYINHIKVSRNLHLVKNASYGFNVLAGCRAFLLPHQVCTITRCLETTPVRYMLADEVGLGKTVEACSILKILMSENQEFKTLIVVPGALVGQWKNELHYKYSLYSEENNPTADVCIVALENLCISTAVRKNWNLAIVDETHRLLGDDKIYSIVQQISKQTAHILLLSATPIQDRNEEYRRLLALLSPEQYDQMTPERFSWLVKKQKRIQQTVNQQLGRLDKFDDYGESILEKINSIVDSLEDLALKKLADSVDISSEDHGKSIATQALSYICENYRIERKVIRNRRLLISANMANRDLDEHSYAPLTADDIYNETGAIQATLDFLANDSDDTNEYITSTAIPLLSALFSSPWAYETQLHKLGITDDVLLSYVTTWKKQAIIEHSLANCALDEDPDLIKGRLMHVLDYIDQNTPILNDPFFKLVVFSGFTETVKVFSELLSSRYSTDIYAVTFCKGMSQEELENSVYSFQNDDTCKIIICDETGGEGRNFQNATQIIHLDVPWNANVLEQRIGRLDRLGRSADADVVSVVFYAENTIEEQLFHIWRDGLKIFHQSLSGLEIITGELNKLIVNALLDDFYNGLNNAFDDILNQADEMRDSVEDEQLFDIGATMYRPLYQGIDNVLNLYDEENDNIFAEAMLGWGRQAGLVAEVPTVNKLIEFKQNRFSSQSAKQSLFIPPKWSHYDNSSIMRRTGQILGSFDRKVAATREDILFFAPGDAVYDSIISNAAGCSRGHCTAIGIKGIFDFDGLVYIYNIDVPINELIEEGINPHTLAQYKMFLPLNQIIAVIPLTASSRKIDEDDVIKLILEAEGHQVTHLGRRSLSQHGVAPLDQFIAQIPPDVWEPLVDECTVNAYRIAYNKMKGQAEIKAAKKEMQRIINGYKAEALYFERSTDIVSKKITLYNATLKALQSAKPVLDSVCFVRIRK
jgi:hypothetical protein